MNDATAPLHVILGAGQIGPMIAERLVARGLRVRMVRRSRPADAPPGVEVVSADLADPRAAAEAMAGAAVAYHTANPRYHRWDAELLPLTRGIVGGAARAGARLVALDNLYMYGRAPDGVMRESSPIAPVSKKGAIRAEAADVMLSAAKKGELALAIGRASDFFGPGATLASMFGDRFWSRLIAGKSVECLGDRDQPHSYSYTPDVADALVTLGTRATDGDLGRVWHLPVLPARSTRWWIDQFAARLGRAPRLTTLGPASLKLFGLFVKEAGEVVEMLYQWKAPFVLDDALFRARFGAAPMPAERAIDDTTRWARATYGRNEHGLAPASHGA